MSLSWTLPSGSVVETYKLEWKILGEHQPIISLSETLSSSTDKYTITGLREYDNVTVKVTVAAVNDAGSNTSVALTLHSAVLHGESRNCEDKDDTCSTSTSTVAIGVIIGGAVGIFLGGLILGCVIVVVVCRVIRNCRKKSK